MLDTTSPFHHASGHSCSETALHEDQIHAILSALESGDFAQRWELAKTLPPLGTAVIPHLVEILEDEDADEELQWFAIRILGNFQHPDALSALTDVLKTSDNEDLKAAVADVLSQFGVDAVAIATKLLAVPQSQMLAVRILECLQCPERVEPLLKLAQNSDPHVQAKAIEALSVIDDQRIEPILWTALGVPGAAVRRQAIISLGLIATRYHLKQEPGTVATFVEKLLPFLHDFNLGVCEQAAITIGRVGTVSAVDGLLAVLTTATTPIPLKLKLVHVLSWMEIPEAIAALGTALGTLNPEDGEVTPEIIRVLGRINKPELKTLGANLLMQVLATNSLSVNLQPIAILGLGQLGDQRATEILKRLQSHSDPQVKLHALAALKHLNHGRDIL